MNENNPFDPLDENENNFDGNENSLPTDGNENSVPPIKDYDFVRKICQHCLRRRGHAEARAI